MSEHSKGTIYECARRYACVVYALSDVLGIDPLTMITERREVCTAVFMQASREGIKIASDVRVPHLQMVSSLVVSDFKKEKAS